jgi:hypothetical protein
MQRGRARLISASTSDKIDINPPLSQEPLDYFITRQISRQPKRRVAISVFAIDVGMRVIEGQIDHFNSLTPNSEMKCGVSPFDCELPDQHIFDWEAA